MNWFSMIKLAGLCYTKLRPNKTTQKWNGMKRENEMCIIVNVYAKIKHFFSDNTTQCNKAFVVTVMN